MKLLQKPVLSLMLAMVTLSSASVSADMVVTSVTPKQVVLLVSLSRAQGKTNSQLERIFRRHFRDHPELEIIVKQQSTQADLWDALHSSKTLAMFWVSHAAATEQRPGFSEVGHGAIVDSDGFDVAPVFGEIGSGLRYVAVVGCETGHVLNSTELESKHPDLKVRLYNRKVWHAPDELKKALHDSDPLISLSLQNELKREELGASPDSDLSSSKHLSEVKLIRSIPFDAEGKLIPSLRVEASGKILGVLPSGVPGTVQELTILVPEARSGKQKFVVTAGDGRVLKRSEIELGSFETKPTLRSGSWKLWKSEEGIPIGVTSRIFHFEP